jgi:HAD superfamily hydrolase (TIGR01450 family)
MVKKCYRGILADLDGTVNRGSILIPGVDATYRQLRRSGVQWMFLSNNATSLATDIAAKINGLGIPVTADQVVTSASALIHTLTEEWSGARALVVGQLRLATGIGEAGITVVEEPSETDIVVVALDTGFTYEKLKRAHAAIQKGALFWATNLDPTFPVPGGFEPGAGSIVAAVATAVGRPPDRVFGKPSPDMATLALRRLKVPAAECLVVGDRMETDILFARNAGMDSALVLTGATAREDVDGFSYAPDYVFDNLVELMDLFDEKESDGGRLK